jgi:hypothetical protein
MLPEFAGEVLRWDCQQEAAPPAGLSPLLLPLPALGGPPRCLEAYCVALWCKFPRLGLRSSHNKRPWWLWVYVELLNLRHRQNKLVTKCRDAWKDAWSASLPCWAQMPSMDSAGKT